MSLSDNREIGTVISSFDGPSPVKFNFVAKESSSEIPVKKDQMVQVSTEEGILIARVEDLKKTNRYFSRAESVKEYQREGTSLSSIFPTERWEFLVGTAVPLGVFSENRIIRPSFPPSPGDAVYTASDTVLKKFFGIDDQGLNLGKIFFHDVEARINLTRLLQKHLAILAMSGAGKSYFTAVLLEELLSRTGEQGRIGIVVIDTHGEYLSLAYPESGELHKKVKIIRGTDIIIPVPELSAYNIAEFAPKMSAVQVRELAPIIRDIKHYTNLYDFNDLCDKIKMCDNMKENSKNALLKWIEELDNLNIFGKTGYPDIKGYIRPGHAVILDISSIINMKAKQIIVTYISRKLFNLRRQGLIPPYVEVIEEAHNFVPEGVKEENALSRNIIETIAREGRKFYASLCLITQRPIQLSTTVLSQCNTHLILRVTNPYDLDHIGKSSEGITRETLNTISSLRVGEALIVGEAVNYPLFIKIRERISAEPKHALSLDKAAKKFEKELMDKVKDISGFI